MLEAQLKEKLNQYYIEYKSIPFTSQRIEYLNEHRSEIEMFYDIKIDNIISRLL